MENKKCTINCDISRCKAKCCYNNPLPIQFVKDNESKILNQTYGYYQQHEKSKQAHFVTIVEEINGEYHCDTDKNPQPCPFLNLETKKCNVYDIRPQLCREFGNHTEWSNMLTCFYHFGLNSDTREFTDIEKDYSFKHHLSKLPKLIAEL